MLGMVVWSCGESRDSLIRCRFAFASGIKNASTCSVCIRLKEIAGTAVTTCACLCVVIGVQDCNEAHEKLLRLPLKVGRRVPYRTNT